jgi:hypothetical protein
MFRPSGPAESKFNFELEGLNPVRPAMASLEAKHALRGQFLEGEPGLGATLQAFLG